MTVVNYILRIHLQSEVIDVLSLKTENEGKEFQRGIHLHMAFFLVIYAQFYAFYRYCPLAENHGLSPSPDDNLRHARHVYLPD